MKYWNVPREHEGRTVAVCASGPSMSAAVAEQLGAAGIPVIAINTTHRLFPAPWMVYAADNEWWTHPTNREVFDKPSLKVSLARPETMPLAPRGVHLLRRSNAAGYTDDQYCVLALSNSGAQAIQIAVKTGAARVLLCGFDFKVTPELCHWHGEHPAGLRKTDPDLYLGWSQKLGGIALALLKRAAVVNCTPGSALGCFPMMPLEDAIAARLEPVA